MYHLSLNFFFCYSYFNPQAAGEILLHSELWKQVLHCFFQTSGIIILVMKIVICLANLCSRTRNRVYNRDQIGIWTREFTESVQELATDFLGKRFTAPRKTELQGGQAANMLLSLLYSLSVCSLNVHNVLTCHKYF